MYASSVSPSDVDAEALRAAVRADGPVLVLNLDAPPADPRRIRLLAALVADRPGNAVTIGLAHRAPDPEYAPLIESATFTLAPRSVVTATHDPGSRPLVPVDDPDDALAKVLDVVADAPSSAAALEGLLRLTATAGVRDGLVAESLTYSMLQSGPEFARWRASRPARPVPAPTRPVIDLRRSDGTLEIALDRPERRNAFGVATREQLIDALAVAKHDPAIEHILLTGRGPVFCAGGDLDEFGTAPDGPRAHMIRLDRSVGARIHALRDRLTARVHGACIGAGIELPAFAGTVLARPDTYFQLPELTLGLVPGAGGTVSITRRIGRWRCAYMALSTARVDSATALDWGLIDGVC